ncbi:MAG: TolC family protein [Planctomycetota bacterium]|nr:MAG: TolC family protein [Planctomycetota bacterium]
MIAGLALSALPACAPSPFDFDPPESRPLLRELPRYSAPTNPDQARQATDVVSTSGDLTLRNALAAALLHNPSLRAVAWEPRLAEASRLQAGLSPNPEIGVEFENFAGSGALSGTDELETTLLLSQLIELGGKRDHRIQVADRAWTVSALDYEAERLEVVTETAARFVRVLELQQKVEFAERARSLAEESRRVIDRRVQAGDVSPIDEIKARLESESARIAADRLKRQLDAARRELSAMWDESDPAFELVLGSLGEVMDVPSLHYLTDRVEAHPEVQRWVAESERRTAAVELERAQAVPDVNAGLGVRYINEIDDAAFVGGVSVPLPLFDRNQGGILAARLRAAQALDEGRASRRELATQLIREHSRLTAAFHEAQSINSALLPAARDAYDATRRAYDEGKLPYLDVLDAQRTLFDTEAQRLEALAEYHSALVQVEGLISAPLSTLRHSEPDASEHPGDTP